MGWVAPVASVARLATSCSPGVAVQAKVQRCHADGDGEGSRLASSHVTQPSTLTSTRSIGPEPDHARPSSVTGPGASTRSRSGKLGMPGGAMSDRTRMRVTGRPSSSSVVRMR